MATLNVGAMAARLGLDPSEFLDKMKGVQGVNGFASAEMSRQWKQTSREGTESMRLIDEALGLHISRPLTRLIATEFPSFAKTMQSVLGFSALGALGAVGFEFGEHIGKNIEKAKKALQDYDDALRHTQDVLGDLGAAHVRTMKEINLQFAGLSGEPGAKLQLAEFKIDTSAMQDAKKNIETITKAVDEQAKAAEKARGFWVQLLNTLTIEPYNFWAKFLGGAEESSSKLKEVDELVSLIMRQHAGQPMKGLQDSLKEVSAQARTTFTELYSLQLANAALANKLNSGSRGVRGAMDERALESGQQKA